VGSSPSLPSSRGSSPTRAVSRVRPEPKILDDFRSPISGTRGVSPSLAWQADVVNDTSRAGADVNADLREITSSAGKLRYYDIGDGPALLFLHGSGRGDRMAQLPRSAPCIRQAVPLPHPGVPGIWSERRLRRPSDVANGSGLGGADHLTTHRVTIMQMGHPAPVQHPRHRSRAQTPSLAPISSGPQR
jgi:hypothetical protein